MGAAARAEALRLRPSGFVLAGIAVEVALVAFGAVRGPLLLAVALPAAAAYFLLAVRFPTPAAVLIWIATPLSIEGTMPGGAAIALPTEPMIGIALLAWTLRALHERRWPLARSPLQVPLAVLGGAALLSILAGGYPIVGLKAWFVSGCYVLIGMLAFAAQGGSPDSARAWIRVVVGSAVFLGLYGAVRSIALGGTAATAYGCARPFFAEHGTYASYLCMVLPLSLLRAVEGTGRDRWMYGGATVAILLGIAFSFTRAAWLATGLVVPIVLGVWAARHGLRRGLAMVGGIVAIVVVSVAASGAAENWTRHFVSVAEEQNVSNLERLNRWSAALEMARAHPWIGVGYGAYPDYYRVYRHKTIVTDQVYYRMGVHNELLRLLAETGVVGLGAALWLLTVIAAGAWRLYARRDDPKRGLLALAILAGLATYAVHSLFNSYLGVDKVTIPFWFGIGALEALRRSAVHLQDAGEVRRATT